MIFSVDSNVPNIIHLDSDKLKQVLINLLNNAIKFTTIGEVTLKVSPVTINKQANIRFEVIDTGAGINKQELQLLFQAFQQTSTGRDSRKGTGLGLAISQNFIQQMGGQIQVESEENKGSRFWFEIPLPENETIALKSTSSQPKLPPQLAPNQSVPKILILEEKKEQRELLTQQLRTIGFMTKTEINNREGIQACCTWQPDLILLDLCMPSVDGRRAIEEIQRQVLAKGHCPQPKIIVITADIFQNQENVEQHLNCDEVLRKPIQIDSLLHSIGQHLEIEYLTPD